MTRPIDAGPDPAFQVRARLFAQVDRLLEASGAHARAIDFWPEPSCPYEAALGVPSTITNGQVYGPADVSTIADILSVAERVLDRQARRALGQYYTPPPLARFLCKRVGLGRTLGPVRLLDPAVGGGGLLLEAFGQLGERARYAGCDVDPFAVFLARAGLALIGANQESVGATIVHADALGWPDRPDELEATLGPIGSYDFVISNPPFIGEQGNRRLFRRTLERYPFWRRHYQARMDYAYWFLILGLLALREGGRLAYVTTAYWTAADGASRLRQFLLEHARVVEIIDFGSLRLFPAAPGQHNLVVVLERCGHAGARLAQPIRVARWLGDRARVPPQSSIGDDHLEHSLACLGSALDGLATARGSSTVRAHQVEAFVLEQSSLSSGSWRLRPPTVLRTLARLESVAVPLIEICEIRQGVVPNPLRLSKRSWSRLSESNRRRVRPGDGVFVLELEEVERLCLPDRERRVLERFVKGSDVQRYRVEPRRTRWLIYLDDARSIDELPTIAAHLGQFRSLLEDRRECRLGRRAWYALHWPRSRSQFEGDKLLCSYRSEPVRFAVSREPLFGSTDLYFVSPKPECPVSTSYLAAVLNSPTAEYWLRHQGRAKGRLTELFPSILARIPIVVPPGISGGYRPNAETERPPTTPEVVGNELGKALTRRDGRRIHDVISRVVDQIVAGQATAAEFDPVIGWAISRLYEVRD